MSWNNERQPIKVSYAPGAGSFGWHNPGAPAAPARRSTQRRNSNGEFASGERPAPAPLAEGTVVVNSWETCRERFLARQNNEVKSYFFKHDLPNGRGRSIAVFFDKIEDKLGILPERRSVFQSTNKKKYCKVTPAPFWDKDEMRRSLFSALLRASVHYRIHNDNFDAALYAVYYTNDTKAAVDRFLKGNYHYWGSPADGIGWKNVFTHADSAKVRKLLRKTKKGSEGASVAAVPPATRAASGSTGSPGPNSLSPLVSSRSRRSAAVRITTSEPATS
jgi:hypothetical protein